MKGSPRSLMLSWANRVAGWWTSAAFAAAQNQQHALLHAMQPKSRPKKARRKRARRYGR
jgi:hypothetical protein